MDAKFVVSLMGGRGLFIYDIKSDGIEEKALLGEDFEKAQWVPIQGENITRSYVKWGELYIDLSDFCRV